MSVSVCACRERLATARVLRAAVMPSLSLLLLPLWADAATWTGANITTANTSTDVELPANWSTGTVPGAAETAVFTWSGITPISANVNAVVVGAGGSFNPSAIELNAGIGSTGSYLGLDRNLSISSLRAYASGTSGGYYDNRLRVGPNSPATLTLTGNSPLDIQTWQIMSVSAGSRVELTGSNINVPAMVVSNGTANAKTGGIGTTGVTAVQTLAQQALNPQFNFAAVDGAIHLDAAGARAEGNLNAGNLSLGVRSDQTWTADAASFIRVGYRIGSSSAGPMVVNRLDTGGTRLDNLEQLNIVLVGGSTGSTGSSTTTGMQLGGGTYGSLRFLGNSTTNRDNHLILADDVRLKGHVVNPGSTTTSTLASADADFGFTMVTGNGTGQTYKQLVLNAKTLTVDHGLLLEDQVVGTTDSTRIFVAVVRAAGSTLNVGGDIVVTSLNNGPAAKAEDASRVLARGLGIHGDAATVVNIGGSYSNRVASMTGGNAAGLSLATVNFVGGASKVETLEVGDAASRMTVGTSGGNFNIAALNVGTSVTPSRLQLVNDYLNDNPIGVGEDLAVARAGEKLIVTSLNVATGSTLDVNGMPVLLGSSLSIAPGGILDLKSGAALNTGDQVSWFVGLGNQVSTWSLYQQRVIDSSNPAATFTPTFVGGNTLWQVSTIPEPAVAGLLTLSVLGLMSRRTRV